VRRRGSSCLVQSSILGCGASSRANNNVETIPRATPRRRRRHDRGGTQGRNLPVARLRYATRGQPTRGCPSTSPSPTRNCSTGPSSESAARSRLGVAPDRTAQTRDTISPLSRLPSTPSRSSTTHPCAPRSPPPAASTSGATPSSPKRPTTSSSWCTASSAGTPTHAVLSSGFPPSDWESVSTTDWVRTQCRRTERQPVFPSPSVPSLGWASIAKWGKFSSVRSRGTVPCVVTNQMVHFCSFWENLVEKQVTFFLKKTCASVLQYHQALDCFVFGIGEQR
jgi:hypothetical protein